MTKTVQNTAIAALTFATVAFGALSSAQATIAGAPTGDISYYGVPELTASTSASATQVPLLQSRAFNLVNATEGQREEGAIGFYGAQKFNTK